MNGPVIKFFKIGLLKGMFVIFVCAQSNLIYAQKNHIEAKPLSSGLNFLKYNKGLIDSKIKNNTLGNVLRELALSTKINISLYDTGIFNRPVSLTVKDKPLADAIRLILYQLSYVFYPVDGGFKLVILSKSAASKQSSSFEIIPLTESDKTQQSNDEQLSFLTDDLSPYIGKGEEIDTGLTSQSVHEHERIEALLDLVNNTINSPTGQLDQEMIDELVNSDDPRATEILRNVESSNTDSSANVIDVL